MTTQGASFAEIRLSNIGPIGEADFTVRPLTLLVGSNGSGKTVASTFIYVLQKALWITCERAQALLARDIRTVAARKQKDPEQVMRAARAVFKDDGPLASVPLNFELELQNALGDGRSVLRHNARSGKFSVKHATGWTFESKITKTSLFSSLDWSLQNIDSIVETAIQTNNDSQFIFPDLVARDILVGILGTWILRPFMIPAGRAGITDSYRYLAERVLLERHGYARSGLAGVSQDFLATLVGVEEPTFRRYGSDRARPIRRPANTKAFDALLGGELRPSDDPDELFTFHVNGHRIQRGMMSSMVKEVGPLVTLMYKHKLDRNTMIVDEPECHLHPSAQVDLARLFVSLVSQGTNFVLSTHSPYLAQSLSSAWILESRVGGVQADGMSLVNFTQGKKGTLAKNADFDSEYGFEFEEFVRIADSVQEEFSGLFG